MASRPPGNEDPSLGQWHSAMSITLKPLHLQENQLTFTATTLGSCVDPQEPYLSHLLIVPTAPGLDQPIYIEASSSHVAEGQTLDLTCVVPGQAHAQVTWYKRGGSLPARHQVQGPGWGSPRAGKV